MYRRLILRWNPNRSGPLDLRNDSSMAEDLQAQKTPCPFGSTVNVYNNTQRPFGVRQAAAHADSVGRRVQAEAGLPRGEDTAS